LEVIGVFIVEFWGTLQLHSPPTIPLSIVDMLHLARKLESLLVSIVV